MDLNGFPLDDQLDLLGVRHKAKCLGDAERLPCLSSPSKCEEPPEKMFRPDVDKEKTTETNSLPYSDKDIDQSLKFRNIITEKPKEQNEIPPLPPPDCEEHHEKSDSTIIHSETTPGYSHILCKPKEQISQTRSEDQSPVTSPEHQKSADIEKCVDDFNKGRNTGVVILDSELLMEKNLRKPKVSYSSIDETRSGSFGTVKKFDDELVEKEIEKKPSSAKEITVPLKISDPGIVTIVGLTHDPNYLWIYMKNAGSPLNELIKQKHFRGHVVENSIHYCGEMYRIVRLMEEQGIAHRDIKLENICAKEEGGLYVFCVIDFGSAQERSEKEPRMSAHTIEYLCPGLAKLVAERRMLQEGQTVNPGLKFFEENGDCYSATIVLLCLLMGRHPINEVNYYCKEKRQQLCQRDAVLKQIISMSESVYKPIWSKEYNFEPVLDLVFSRALCLDKERRWSASKCYAYLERQCKAPQRFVEQTVPVAEKNLADILMWKVDRENIKAKDNVNTSQGQDDGMNDLLALNLKAKRSIPDKNNITSSFELSESSVERCYGQPSNGQILPC